ncbi:MAG: TonB-dependent receptor [Hyphomonadaceae bacterium]
MMMGNRFLVLAVSSIALIASGAVAQSSGDAADGGLKLDEVVVTAQKRVENLQDVPISVDTLDGERFADFQAGGGDILQLAARVPGVYAESSNGRLAPRFYIRGLGNVDFDLAASQPVSIIIDDVVQENVLLKSNPIFDSEQVEVLRGPQGTLFGRNTPAGIIKFDSRRPTQEFSGNATISAGSFGTVHAEGGVGGPIVQDLLAFRASGLYRQRNDFIDNAFNGDGDDLGNFDEFAGRLQLLITPTEQLDVLLNIHGRTLDATSAIFRANVLTTGSNDLNDNFDRDTVFFDGGQDNVQDSETWGVSGSVNYDLGFATFTSITGYESGNSSSVGDIDGGVIAPLGTAVPDGITSAPTFGDTAVSFPGFIPFPSETQDSLEDLDQFTQEVRLASNSDGPLNWQVGAYYFDTSFDITTVGAGFPPLTTVSHGSDSWSLFGQASYDVSDQLTVTGGLRYTNEDREFSVPLAPGAPVDPISVSDDDVSWDVSALYKVSDGINLYARVASGFRGPTIQGRDVAFFGDPTVAESETILSYEVGLKSDLLQDRLRFNLTGYYYEIDDQQFSIIGGAGNTNQVVNADQGVGFGLEADVEFIVTENLFVQAGLGWNDTEIQDDTLATAVCGSGQCTPTDPLNEFGQALIDGNPFPNAPEITFNIFAEYTYPFRNHGEFFVNTDWAVQGETNLFLYEAVEFRTSGQFEGALQLGYREAAGRYSLAFFARNLTDEENVKGAIDFNNLTAFVNQPRVFGAQLSASF